jgi:5-methylcytosine-specific restriction endonuclease McrA
MRRRFSSRERVALYLAAGGRCARCGERLAAGWHADHVVAYVRGGATDVVNGQALCAGCNQRKGQGDAGGYAVQGAAMGTECRAIAVQRD